MEQGSRSWFPSEWEAQSTELSTAPVNRPHVRYDNIDCLRMVAIVMVVAFHYTARFPADYYRTNEVPFVIPQGWLGVDLFFMVSAFCIYMSLDTSRGVVSFLAKRFARIQPAFVASVLLTLVIVAAIGLEGREVGPEVALYNIAWLNVILELPYVDGVYWSLVVEVKFYVVIGLLYFTFGKDRLFAGWTSFCILGAVMLRIEPEIANRLFIANYAPQFLIGLFAFEWPRARSRDRLIKGVLCLVLIAATPRLAPVLWEAIALMMAGFVVLQITSIKLPTWVTYIGLVSYPLYLVHQNIGLIVIRELPIESFIIRAAIAFAVVLAIAACLSRTIEARWKKPIERSLVLAADRLRMALPGV
ncbi:MAG: acyltransferase [Pontixanthobacter sp.]